MKLLGNRLLLSRVEEPKADGFQTVNVQDSFVNKGKVEQVGNGYVPTTNEPIQVGDTVLFAKYSPDTQDIEHEGKKYKVITVEDVIAVL
jgi:co-chaperonin GroES (HSP10)